MEDQLQSQCDGGGSEYADHHATVRGRTDLERADNRLNSVWFGSANALKQDAYQAALQLAANG